MKRTITVISAMLNIAVIIAMVMVYTAHQAEAEIQARLSTITEEDQHCLAQNIFWEARNQSVEGQVAVAWVTINRMEDAQFPMSLCDVVRQGQKDAKGNMIRHKCQFSWYCDGKSDRIPNNAIADRAWQDAQLIATVVLIDWAKQAESPVENATFYHADYVNPYWAELFTEVTTIDNHIFYVN